MGQGQGCQDSRKPSQGRSTKRCHWPSRGRCSHSRSCSRSRSQTWDIHSIEINQYNDDCLLKTFNTIYRSRSVATISNDADPDGRTKILTQLKIKLPHHKVIDNLQVKVDNGAEALYSFRSMFPHALNEDGYPKDGFLKGLRTMLQCYDDCKLTNHGKITLQLQHYTNKSFQDH